MHRFSPVTVLFGACLSLIATQTVAAEPVALVIDVVGGADPAIAPFDELTSGDEIALERNAEMIVQHYEACSETHMMGGVVAVGRDGVRHSGGETIAVDEVSCPEKVTFVDGGDDTGALVLRSAANAAIAPRPVFIAPGATRLDVLLEGETVASLALTRGPAYWPEDAPDLVIGGIYELRLWGPSGEQVAGATVRPSAGPAILRMR